MDYSPRYKCFRTLLRTLREEAGLTQAALALKLRKAQTFVSESESGERRIDFIETLDFCSCCGVSVMELVQRLEHAVSEANNLPVTSLGKFANDVRR